jgi:hypothetical protein
VRLPAAVQAPVQEQAPAQQLVPVRAQVQVPGHLQARRLVPVQAASELALAPGWEATAAELDYHQVCRPVAGSLQPVYRSAEALQRPGLPRFFSPKRSCVNSSIGTRSTGSVST